LEAATSVPAVIALLRLTDFGSVADHLSYLNRLSDEDEDLEPLSLVSAKSLATFLMNDSVAIEPQISRTEDGAIHAQWKIEPQKLVAIQFLNDGQARFAAIGARPGGKLPPNVNGVVEASKVRSKLGDFLSSE
jgi:hypothetical protein